MSNRLPQRISGISTQANDSSQRMLQDFYVMLFPNFHIVCWSLRATFRIPCRCALFSACGKDGILSPVKCHKLIKLVQSAPIPECFLPKYRVDRNVPLYYNNSTSISVRFPYARHFPFKTLQLLLL